MSRQTFSSFYGYAEKHKPKNIVVDNIRVYYKWCVTGEREISYFPKAWNAGTVDVLKIAPTHVHKIPTVLGKIVEIYINPFSSIRGKNSAKDYYFENEARALIEAWFETLKEAGLDMKEEFEKWNVS